MYFYKAKYFTNGNMQIQKYENGILEGVDTEPYADWGKIRELKEDNFNKLARKLEDDYYIVQDKKDERKRDTENIRLCELSKAEYESFLIEYFEKRSKIYMQNSKRDKKKVYDLARANQWDWFLTFTFDKNKVNRFDYNECVSKLKKWLNNFSSRKCYGHLKYLIIPEKHKNGAWHFHGLFANAPDTCFEFSGVVKDGNLVFNLTSYKLGYTTATKVKDTNKVSHYITKYMTKELTTDLKGKNRHLASRNLNKPIEFSSETLEQIEDYFNISLEDERNELLFSQEKSYVVNNYVNKVTYEEYLLNEILEDERV